MYWLVHYGAVVWQVALVTLLVAGALLGEVRSRRRANAQARAKRAALGEPRRQVGDAREGADVTLVGTLRASGTLCASFVDRALVAATSAGPDDVVSVIDARAEQLEVVLEDGAVRIEGPVTVLVGTHEAWPKRRLEHLPSHLLASVGLTPTSWISGAPRSSGPSRRGSGWWRAACSGGAWAARAPAATGRAPRRGPSTRWFPPRWRSDRAAWSSLRRGRRS